MKTSCCSFPGDRSAAMSNEHTPLITSGMCGLTVNAVTCGGSSPDVTPDSGPEPPNKSPRQLNTFFGVMVPTVLSMFSIVLFLRTGEKERKKKKKNFCLCRTLTLPLVVSLCRVRGGSCWTSSGSFNGLRGLLHYISNYSLHLCHLHQRCRSRRRSLLYPAPCCL